MVSELSSFDGDRELDLIGLVQAAWRDKLLICSIALAFAAGAAVIALVLTPIYRAEVVVMEVQDSNLNGISAVAGQLGGLASLAGLNLGASGGAGQQARAVLMSRHLAEEFISRNRLEKVLMPEGRSSLWEAVQIFRASVLKIREDKLKNTISVSIDWRDPAAAARWANDFVALANETMRARAASESASNIAYLTKQIANTTSVEVQRALYTLIESETKTLMLANARAEYALMIIDPAVKPELRVSPKRTLMVIVATLIGGLLGLGVVVIRRALRQRLAQETARQS